MTAIYKIRLPDGRVAAITDCPAGPVQSCGNRRCPFHLEHEAFFRTLPGGAVVQQAMRPRSFARQIAQRDTSVDCAIWVASGDGRTLEEVGALLGFTRERARQLEDKAIKKIKWFLRQTNNRELARALREGFEELKG